MIIIPDKDSRPFGILSNGVLPIRIGKEYYPTVDHYRMASILADPVDRANVLSYAGLDQARIVFNRLDEEQYVKLVRAACDEFHRKKIRSLQVGRDVRRLLKETTGPLVYRVERDDLPMKTILGVVRLGETAGYNAVGQSLEKMRRILEGVDVDDAMETIYWRVHPEKEDILPVRDREYQFHKALPKEDQSVAKKKKEEKRGEKMDRDYEEYDYEDTEDEYDEEEEEARMPDAVEKEFPPDRTRAIPWRYAPAGAYIDEEKWSGLERERMYFRDLVANDPLANSPPIEEKTDAFHVFKISKVVDHLISLMRNGIDIENLRGKQIDAILWEGRICPEIFFSKTLTSRQRHEVYVDTWDKFKKGVLPNYDLIVKEIIYPGNIVGFIRKAYIKDLNAIIGRKIKDVLFRVFLDAVIAEKYPEVPLWMRPSTVFREARMFSFAEFDNMTDRLYHLVFSGRFRVPEEEMKRLRFYESQRKTLEQVEEALQFIPVVGEGTAVDSSSVLDPMATVSVSFGKKKFTDLFQYVYFMLYKFYGNLTGEEAYRALHDQDFMLPGNHPFLQERLARVVEARRYSLLEGALQVKLETYPQVGEILLYLRSTGNTDIRFQDIMDTDTGRAWRKIIDELPETDVILMDLVVSLVERDFEKSIFLYFIISDLFRSMEHFKKITGSRLQRATLDIFLRCFGRHLARFKAPAAVPPVSPLFNEYVKKKNVLVEGEWARLWEFIYPIIDVFRGEDFSPALSFIESKSIPVLDENVIRAIANVVGCLYPVAAEIPKDDLHVLVEIMSGADNIPPWMDSSFEMLMENPLDGEDNLPPQFHILPDAVREKLLKYKKSLYEKKKTKKKDAKRVVRYDLIHPETSKEDALILRDLFGDNEANVSRVSYAVAALRRHLRNPRRIRIFL